jgi:hypothetical protein
VVQRPPGSERIMPEEMRTDRADTTAWRPPWSPLAEGAILALHGGWSPPCPIQEAPWPGRGRAECPQQQRMLTGVKAPLDVQRQAPVRAPTPLPGDAEGLYGRLARSIALRVRMNIGLKDGL